MICFFVNLHVEIWWVWVPTRFLAWGSRWTWCTAPCCSRDHFCLYHHFILRHVHYREGWLTRRDVTSFALDPACSPKSILPCTLGTCQLLHSIQRAPPMLPCPWWCLCGCALGCRQGRTALPLALGCSSICKVLSLHACLSLWAVLLVKHSPCSIPAKKLSIPGRVCSAKCCLSSSPDLVQTCGMESSFQGFGLGPTHSLGMSWVPATCSALRDACVCSYILFECWFPL